MNQPAERPMGKERKEKVIHTRIPAALEEQIKRLADGLRVPVSNLVRNMLEDALDVTRRMRGAHDDKKRATALEHVYAWQPITLNRATSCVACDAPVAIGTEAMLGLSDHPRDMRVFICTACVPQAPATAEPAKAARKKPNHTARKGKPS